MLAHIITQEPCMTALGLNGQNIKIWKIKR